MIKEFDPRLKIILALSLSYITFKLTSIFALSLHYFLIISLFLGIGAYKSTIKILKYVFLLFLISYISIKMIDYSRGFIFLSTLSFFLIKFSPIALMLEFVITKMKTGHFIASMQSIHMPKSIIILFAVLFRFLPTLKIELKNIKEAMKLRGINFSLSNLLKDPLRTIEYAGIPLILRSMSLSDTLSAAAMTRGLDLKKKNTSYVDLDLRISRLVFAFFILGLSILNMYFDNNLYVMGTLL